MEDRLEGPSTEPQNRPITTANQFAVDMERMILLLWIDIWQILLETAIA